MFYNIDEARLAVVGVVAIINDHALCFLAQSAMLHGSLSARRQTAFVHTWCMSTALTETDMVYAQSPLAVRE